jgi:cysteinyl-tRNA synthetase
MIQFYDSLRGTKIPLQKKTGEKISMYVCGPTVYDSAHLGHGRSAVAFDLIRRFLEWSGYEVTFVSNITDIEDKMIARAERDGITVPELAQRIIPEYERDYGLLNVKAPNFRPRATEYISEMIALIQKLEEKGHTYLLEDGVYFDVNTFGDYGKLSHQKMEELEAGARVEERTDKRNHQDFVLWKLKKEGEPFWGSPWGDGRPGWHIECSAMAGTLLGENFDIHGGGLDLKFPHHECEVAQTEAATGKPLSKIWMHNGYITVNAEKMSKSLGNFFTLKDIFLNYHPRVIRFFLLGTHYRSPIEYSVELLDQARSTLKNLDEFYLTHKDGSTQPDADVIKLFGEKLANDLDIAGGLAVIFEWMKNDPENIEATLLEINKILQVLSVDFRLTEAQKELLSTRNEARAAKDWARSDALRQELAEQGIEVMDSSTGSIAKPLL